MVCVVSTLRKLKSGHTHLAQALLLVHIITVKALLRKQTSHDVSDNIASALMKTTRRLVLLALLLGALPVLALRMLGLGRVVLHELLLQLEGELAGAFRVSLQPQLRACHRRSYTNAADDGGGIDAHVERKVVDLESALAPRGNPPLTSRW